ncbi:MAG: DUF2946 family protein [Litorimonas sp.]
MIRLTHNFLILILALGLVLGAGIGGYKRTAHAVARAGMTQIVICATDGAETVQLDRDGNAVAPSSTTDCAHCADCSLVPLATLTALADVSADAVREATVFVALTSLPTRAVRVGHPSRGPPSKSKV